MTTPTAETWKARPRVSVLLPTYNKAHFVDEAIRSVLDQTYRDFELIVVDDCSQDDTGSVVRPYLTDPRVRYFENPRNLGIGGNWNQALSHARGVYIKYLMGDDKFHPELLARYTRVMDENPDVALVTSHRAFFGDREGIKEQPVTGKCNGKEAIRLSFFEGNWIGEPTTVMFRASNLWLGTFKVEYQFVLDWDMWLRHLTHGDLYVVPEVLTYFRQDPGQMTRRVKENFRDIFEEYHLLNDVLAAPQLYGVVEDRAARRRVRKRLVGLYKRIPVMLARAEYRLAWQSLRYARRERVLGRVAAKALLRVLRGALGSSRWGADPELRGSVGRGAPGEGSAHHRRDAGPGSCSGGDNR